MTACLGDLNLEHLWVVYPGNKPHKLHEKITVMPLTQIGNEWKYDS